MEIVIGEVIRKKRREMNINQEVLAESLGVTIQAVSKWENGLSNPEITMLPKIAEYFGVTLNELFYGIKETGIPGSIPDDGKIRIVQCIGTRVLCHEEYKKGERIELALPEYQGGGKDPSEPEAVLNFEVWGNAKIDGYVYGNVSAGSELYCGNVGGNANAGTALTCSSVSGNAEAGTDLTCAHVGGSVSAGGGLTCGNIGADASAGTYIDCKEIYGSVKAESVSCGGNIGGNVICGMVNSRNIKG